MHDSTAVGITNDICIYKQCSKDGKCRIKKACSTCLCASVSDHLEPCRIRRCARCQAGEIQQSHSLSQSPEASQIINISLRPFMYTETCQRNVLHPAFLSLTCTATWQTSLSQRMRASLRLELTFEAGSDIRAPASSASSLPKTGAPNPFGQLRTMHVTSPPQESPFFRMSSMTAVTLML